MVPLLVPAHDSPQSRHWLPLMLRSYRECTPGSMGLLIILAGGDNAWGREVQAILRQESLPALVITLGRNLGFLQSINKGIEIVAESSPRYVGILNTDIDFRQGWLQSLISAFDDDSALGCCGYTGLATKPFVEFSCALLRWSAIRDYRPLLDPRFGMGYFDDDDLCLRLMLDGWKLRVVEPRLCFHHLRGSCNDWMEVDAQIEHNKTVFLDKWKDNPRAMGVLR